MVILNIDHPDIAQFIRCKAEEEKKAHVLISAGYPAGFDQEGGAYDSIQYQNANHSVRVTDEFMRAVEDDGWWETRAVTTGEVAGRYRARELMRMMAEAAWVCGDPGIQYDTTDQPLAHLQEHRPHQRLEPVLGVHVPRRHRVQPGVAEPHAVRRTRRATSTPRRSGTPSTS